MTAFDIVTEVKRYHVQVKDPESTDEGWCKGCESDWPCDTQLLVDEIEASRKKLAAVRALLDHEDTAGHRLVPDDSRMESDGLGILETWQVRYVLDGTMP